MCLVGVSLSAQGIRVRELGGASSINRVLSAKQDQSKSLEYRSTLSRLRCVLGDLIKGLKLKQLRNQHQDPVVEHLHRTTPKIPFIPYAYMFNHSSHP